jgi:hypothetical protein
MEALAGFRESDQQDRAATVLNNLAVVLQDQGRLPSSSRRSQGRRIKFPEAKQRRHPKNYRISRICNEPNWTPPSPADRKSFLHFGQLISSSLTLTYVTDRLSTKADWSSPREKTSRSPTHRIVATSELTGRSKTRNGDDRPSGPESWRLGRRVPPEPGSGDGKTVANSGQMGLLVDARCYLPLNNG